MCQVGERLGINARALVRLFNAKRAGAKRRDLLFALDLDQFVALAQSPCAYCGTGPANVARIKGAGYEFFVPYSGIDRVDNTRGYEPDNVVSCCGACNTAKSERSVADFIAHAQRIVERAK